MTLAEQLLLPLDGAKSLLNLHLFLLHFPHTAKPKILLFLLHRFLHLPQLPTQLLDKPQLLHILLLHLLTLDFVALDSLQQNVGVSFDLVDFGAADSQIMDLGFVELHLAVDVGAWPFLFAVEGELFDRELT